MNEENTTLHRAGQPAPAAQPRGPADPHPPPPLVSLSDWTGEGLATLCQVPEPPAVILSRAALVQALAWAAAVPGEVSALGTVERDGPIFYVDRFHLVEQTSTGASVELAPGSVARLVESLAAEGGGGEAERLRCWLHSHPGMKAFWSATDEGTCRRLGGEYLVSIVIGLGAGEPPVFRARIDLCGPVPITLDRVPVLAEVALGDAETGSCAAEARGKVRPEVFRRPGGGPIVQRLAGEKPRGRPDAGTHGQAPAADLSDDEPAWWRDYGLTDEDFEDPFYRGGPDGGARQP